MTTAGEATVILASAPVDFERVKTILAKEIGNIVLVQLKYNLPVHVAFDEVEKRLAITFLHLLSEREQIDSKVREFCLSLAQKVAQDVNRDAVSESYKLVLIMMLSSENPTQESEEEFMALAVAHSLSTFFERKTGLTFKL